MPHRRSSSRRHKHAKGCPPRQLHKGSYRAFVRRLSKKDKYAGDLRAIAREWHKCKSDHRRYHAHMRK